MHRDGVGMGMLLHPHLTLVSQCQKVFYCVNVCFVD